MLLLPLTFHMANIVLHVVTYYIGCRSCKVIAMLVYSKKCTKCDVYIALREYPIDHEECLRNYLISSSKAMEVSAAIDIIVELHEKNF